MSPHSLLPVVTMVAFGAASMMSAQTSPAAIGPRQGVATSHTSLAVIVNKQNRIDELPAGELRKVFLGEARTWPDGRKITVVMRNPGDPERDALLRLVCGMSERDYTRHVLHAEFRGELQGGPKLLASATGARRFVFNVPGAIGYLWSDDVDDSVKVLRISGNVSVEPASGLRLRVR